MKDRMDWQQKAAALNALAEISLCIRNPDDWYVRQSVEVGGDGMLVSEYGNGTTPEDAINDHWCRMCEDLAANRYLVLHGTSDRRRHVRWNGFMWVDLPLPTKGAAP